MSSLSLPPTSAGQESAVGTPQQPPGRGTAGAECDAAPGLTLGTPRHCQDCPAQQDTATSRSCSLSPDPNLLLPLSLGLRGPETGPTLQGHGQYLLEGIKHPELPQP